MFYFSSVLKKLLFVFPFLFVFSFILNASGGKDQYFSKEIITSPSLGECILDERWDLGPFVIKLYLPNSDNNNASLIRKTITEDERAGVDIINETHKYYIRSKSFSPIVYIEKPANSSSSSFETKFNSRIYINGEYDSIGKDNQGAYYLIKNKKGLKIDSMEFYFQRDREYEDGRDDSKKRIRYILQFDEDNTFDSLNVSSNPTIEHNEWASESSATFSANYSETKSGLDKINSKWYYGDLTETIDSNITVHEGETSISCVAIDNVGNFRKVDFKAKLDNTPPSDFTSFTPFIKSIDGIDHVHFEWDQVSDSNGTISVSGLDKYILSVGGISYETNEKNTHFDVELNDIGRNSKVSASIRAYDHAGNVNVGKTLNDFVIPQSATIKSISYQTPYVSSSNVHYPVTVKFQISDSAFNNNWGYEQLLLHNTNLDSTYSFILPENRQSTNSIEIKEEGNNIYAICQFEYAEAFDLSTQDFAQTYAHKKFIYKVETIHKINEIDLNGNLVSFREVSSEYLPSEPIANIDIKNDYRFRVFEETTNSISEIHQIESKYWIKNLPVYIQLWNGDSKTSSYYDPEGDLLTLSLSDNKKLLCNSELGSNQYLSGQVAKLENDIFSTIQGDIQVTILEKINAAISLENASIVLPLFQDKTSPKDFTIKLFEGTQETSLINHNDGFKLNVTGILETQSGVKDVLAIIDYDNIGPEEAFNSASASDILTLSDSNSTYSVPISFSFPEFSETSCYIYTKVSDKAGNCGYGSLQIQYDDIAPGIPEISISHNIDSSNNKNIKFSTDFDSSEDITSYAYNWDNNEYNTQGVYSKNVSSLDPNSKHTLSLTISDEAGNTTESILFDYYTLAQPSLDQIKSIDTFRTVLSGQEVHGLEISLSAPNGYILDDNSSVVDDDILESNYKFFDLIPHKPYSFKYIPVNSQGYYHESNSVKFSAATKNYAPASLSLNFPSDSSYIKSDQVFSFFPTSDFDGDKLTYGLQIADSWDFNSILQDTYLDNNTYEFDSNIDFLDGNSYYWKIVCSDSFETPTGIHFTDPTNSEYIQKTTHSTIRSFTIDDSPPLLSYSFGDNDPYHSSKTLEVTLTDQFSGVDPDSIELIASDTDSDDLQILSSLNDVYSINLAEGHYNLTVNYSDLVGNTDSYVFSSLSVDSQAPNLIGPLKINKKSEGLVSTYLPNVLVSFFANDLTSGIKELRYRFLKDDKTVYSSGIIDISNMTPINGLYEVSLDISDFVNLELYHIELLVVDRAGHESISIKNTSLYVSRNFTAPEVDVQIVKGMSSSGGKNYISDLNSVNLNVSHNVEDESLLNLLYGIESQNNQTVTTWYNSFDDLKSGFTPEDGQCYSIAVVAENGSGIPSMANSEYFIFDQSAPSLTVFTLESNEPYVFGDILSLDLIGIDEHSDIESYEIQIGNLNTPTLISNHVFGNVTGLLSINNHDSSLYKFVLPEEIEDVVDGQYKILCRTKNNAGLYSGYYELEFEINSSQEKIIVFDNSLYSSDVSEFHGQWKYIGRKEVEKYEYAVLAASDNRLPNTHEWISTDITSIELTFNVNNQLVHGETYQLFVRAIFSDDSYSPIYTNNGVQIDTTAVHLVESFEVPNFSQSKRIPLSWTIEDLESGIKSLSAIVEKVVIDEVEGEVITSFDKITQIPLKPEAFGSQVFISTDQFGNPLDCETGDRLYVVLRTENGAGSISEFVSNQLIIDDSPPPVPLVIDAGDSVHPEQKIRCEWALSPLDKESGIDFYQWKIFSSNQNMNQIPWSDKVIDTTILDNSTYYSKGGVNNETYYVAVRAVNKAGLSSVGISNGIFLDDEAPRIYDVTLIGAIGDEKLRYINGSGPYQLKIDGSDNHLIDRYNWTYGKYNKTGHWIPSDNWETEFDPIFNVSTSQPLDNGDIISFQAKLQDTSENKSLTVSSQSVMFDNSIPELTDLHGRLINNSLVFHWGSKNHHTPIDTYNYRLLKRSINGNGQDLCIEGNTINTTYQVDITTEDFEDNIYYLEVQAKTLNGSSSAFSMSSGVLVDRTPPDVLSFENDRFTSGKINMEVSAFDDLSNITEYQYAIGYPGIPFSISGTWKSILWQGSKLFEELSFSDLPDKSELSVLLRVKNSVGLWSETVRGIPILVDRTPALVNDLEVRNEILIDDQVYFLDRAYTSDTSLIDKIDAVLKDEESGITSFQMGYFSPSLQNVIYWDSIKTPSGNEEEGILKNYSLLNGVVEGYELAHGEEYQVAIKATNGTGDVSMYVLSNPVLADFVPPAIDFKPVHSAFIQENLHKELLTDDSYRLISNGDPIDVYFAIDEEDSEKVFVQFGLYLTEQSYESNPDWHSIDFNSMRSIPFNKTDSDGYGEYKLVARLRDSAGNYVDQGGLQTIRLNSPPDIFLESIFTTPGQPLQYDLQNFSEDSDGLGGASWEWGNGTSSSGLVTDLVYFHHNLGDQISEYTLELNVWDQYGKENHKNVLVHVANTTSGTLFTHEYWSGKHNILGNIQIPSDLTLHIDSNSKIEVNGLPSQIHTIGLDVFGSLIIEDNVSFSIHEDLSGHYWKGIKVLGSIDIGSSSISNASRGVILGDSSESFFKSTSFKNNMIGIHLIDCSPDLIGLSFIDHTEYGIKEDGLSFPKVQDCFFQGNTFDYYQKNQTAITIEELLTNKGITQ